MQYFKLLPRKKNQTPFLPFLFSLVVVCSFALGSGCTSTKAEEDKQLHFEPNWDSLRQRTVPTWYSDGKFGIFIHWGVYSVPAWRNEGYARNMYVVGDTTFSYHLDRYGDQSEFGYKDFIPMFTAEKWDPTVWAELFQRSGARFVIQVAEDRDGFPLFDCSSTTWDAKAMGPRRDILRELSDVIRQTGLKFGVSSYRAHHWFNFPHHREFDTGNPDYADFYGPLHSPDTPPNDDFVSDWYSRTLQLIDDFQPDLLWLDFGPLRSSHEDTRKRIAAYYYNRGLDWNKGVVLSFKEEGYPDGVAVEATERTEFGDAGTTWQFDTPAGRKSWGYVLDESYKTPDELIDELVDIISKNGIFLLGIGPRPDGSIPSEQEYLLLEMGRWLEINGEAVYDTRPWKKSGERVSNAGKLLASTDSAPTPSQEIRFTSKGDTLYAVLLDWPEGAFTITSLAKGLSGTPDRILSVELLGDDALIGWKRDKDGLTIEYPERKPGDYAYAFRIRHTR